MYTRTRQQLARNLIFSRPAFLPSFMEINEKLYEMQLEKAFLVPKGQKPHEVEEFYRDQKTERENVKQNYLDRVDEIVKKLETLV